MPYFIKDFVRARINGEVVELDSPHRPALPRHRAVAEGFARVAGPEQHDGRHRTQSGRDQNRRSRAAVQPSKPASNNGPYGAADAAIIKVSKTPASASR
jgi:hypothetical protein